MIRVVPCVLLGFCCFLLVNAGPVDDSGSVNSVHVNEYTSVEDALMKKLNVKCANRDTSSCLMLKMVVYFNRLLKKSSIEFGEVEITKISEDNSTESARSLNEIENMSEDAQLFEVVGSKVWSFIKTRSLTWKVTDDADVVLSGGSDQNGALNLGLSLRPKPAAPGTEEARKKKNSGMGGLMAAMALKMGLLKAIAIKALALLVGKALLVAKLALVLASVIGLKKLFSSEKHVTYEVVAHPHHEHEHHHSFSGGGGGHDFSSGGGGGGGHHGWGRTLDAGDLAYSAQKPATS